MALPAGTKRYPTPTKATKPKALSPSTTVDTRGVSRYQKTPVPSGHGDATGNVNPGNAQFQQGGAGGAAAPNNYLPPIHIAHSPIASVGNPKMMASPNNASRKKILPFAGSV